MIKVSWHRTQVMRVRYLSICRVRKKTVRTLLPRRVTRRLYPCAIVTSHYRRAVGRSKTFQKRIKFCARWKRPAVANISGYRTRDQSWCIAPRLQRYEDTTRCHWAYTRKYCDKRGVEYFVTKLRRATQQVTRVNPFWRSHQCPVPPLY